MSNDPDDISDDEQPLLDELRSSLGPDPIPPGLIERAEALVTWFDIDDELVAMLRDAAEEPAGVRGGGPRGLVFASPDGAIEIDVEIDRGGTNTVVGYLTSGEAVSATLLDAEQVALASADVDVLGRFELSTQATGPCRIRLHDTTGDVVVYTDWFTL